MTTIDENARRLAASVRECLAANAGRRVLVAIAGAPGSGKSTLAEALVARLNDAAPATAALFPMDGYHYDDPVLEAMGRRAHKGAPDTFDVHGLRHALQRLKANEDDAVAVPVFDRDIEIARAGGRLIPRSADIVVCEGNYLLMRLPPWDRLKPLFDLTVFVDVPEAELRRRLAARWEGLGLPAEEVRFKVERNDLPNGVSVIEGSAEPDIRIRN